jgi:muramidase (phage lysozyme)
MTTEDQAKRAFLDALAAGESDPSAKAEGISPYFILYGGGSFEHLARTVTGFPLWSGRDNSHAAGRFQFEPRTWAEQAHKLGLTDFSPESQDAAAWDLAATVYHHVTGGGDLLADLIADDLASIPDVLRSTWTSLSNATFPERYHAALAAIQADGATIVVPSPASSKPYPGLEAATGIIVKAWQKEHGLDPDGIPGPMTWAAILANGLA